LEVISIHPSGVFGRQASVSQPGARITDSRHLHFDLGWSIQGADTLRLIFIDAINGNVQQDIAMADYFNAGQTDFFWQGTIDVYGEDQTLVVNTHLLNASDTLLSIHRNRELNTKEVNISIIQGLAKDIVSYQADGTASVGAFGGSMMYQ